VSCWSELHEQQQELVRSLETAFLSPNIPPEILQILLNLAEFMEHDNKPLPVDVSHSLQQYQKKTGKNRRRITAPLPPCIFFHHLSRTSKIRTLGALAEKCHAYAKALRYKETEFRSSPATCIEALISINNQLQQPEAAIGILLYAQQNHSIELKESWYEKLRRWEGIIISISIEKNYDYINNLSLIDALAVYERKQKDDPTSTELMLGRMRCLHALGEWDRLSQLSKVSD
jgi:FKBP12-rapamycin complex-associated protein